jgi:hypothetical protein
MNLINQIDDFLLMRNKRKRESYYPSDVTSCSRKLFYKWQDVEETNPITAGNFWKMEMGNALHDMVAEFLENSGLEIINEISFKKDIGLDYPISGRLDNLFIDEDGELAGIEIKTSFGRGIKEIQRSGKPRDSDLAQVVMYMGCNPEIKRFYIIYVGRDNGYRTQFIINQSEYIDNIFSVLLQKLATLEDSVKNNICPDREFSIVMKNGEIRDKFQKDKVVYKSDWQCFPYCVFCNYCWQEIIEIGGTYYGREK